MFGRQSGRLVRTRTGTGQVGIVPFKARALCDVLARALCDGHFVVGRHERRTLAVYDKSYPRALCDVTHGHFAIQAYSKTPYSLSYS